MSPTKRVYLLQTTLLMVLMGVVAGGCYAYFFSDCYFTSYPLIPLFFYAFGIFMIYVFERYNKKHSFTASSFLRTYLLMRMVRMLASIVVMIIFCMAVREKLLYVLLAFVVNYLVYLIYDSWFFSHMKKKA